MPIHRVPEVPRERIKINHRDVVPAHHVPVKPPFEAKSVDLKSYYHSGNLGDLIYALAAIRKAGGGTLVVGPEQNQTHRADKPIMEPDYQLLAPLLSAQSCLTAHSYSPHYRGIINRDLNIFRNQWNDPNIRAETGINLLAWMHFYTLGIQDLFRPSEPWLEVPAVIDTGRIIINRTTRYRNDLFNWQTVLRHFGSRNLLFVGTMDEHREFCRIYSSDIEFHPVPDFLELAKVIAGSRGFIGNQSFPMALALGVGQRVLQEAWPNSPDCFFQRSNVRAYVHGDFFAPKDLEQWSGSILGDDPVPEPADERSTPVLSLLCHNRMELTVRCLEMLLRNTPDARIIITNNASTDQTRNYLEEMALKDRRLILVHNNENLGYKEPHENAFKMACSMDPKPDFFCILNNDVDTGRGWWQRIEEAFSKNPKLAIVGNKCGACSLINERFEGSPARPDQTPEYVEGSLFAVRVPVMEKLGLFDPNLQFIYGEDSDASLRAREAGYDIQTIDCNCRHLSNQTVKYLNDATKHKIAMAKAHNHRYLVDRWKVYIRRRNFRYDVLINREGAIGDLILATPAIEALKAKWPDAQIKVKTRCPQVFTNSPTTADASCDFGGQFDYRFDLDLCYENRPMVHPVLCYADALGVKVNLDQAKLRLYPYDADKRQADSLLTVSDRRPLVIVHPGPTRWTGRDWMLERWVEVIEWLSDKGCQVVVIGTPWRFEKAVNLSQPTSLQSLYVLMQKAAFFLGVDSGPFHVAQAANLKSVVLFGTIYSHLRIMPSVRVIPVQAEEAMVPCVGEHHRFPPPLTFSTCNGDCMLAISVDMVKAACETIE